MQQVVQPAETGRLGHHQSAKLPVGRKRKHCAEQDLWIAFRCSGLARFAFLREVCIGDHCVAFLCRERAMVIMIDNDVQPSRHHAHRLRDEDLMRQGFSVFHASRADVRNNIESVLAAIQAVLEGRIEEFVDAEGR